VPQRRGCEKKKRNLSASQKKLLKHMLQEHMNKNSSFVTLLALPQGEKRIASS
jgi:hypothetical protein